MTTGGGGIAIAAKELTQSLRLYHAQVNLLNIQLWQLAEQFI